MGCFLLPVLAMVALQERGSFRGSWPLLLIALPHLLHTHTKHHLTPPALPAVSFFTELSPTSATSEVTGGCRLHTILPQRYSMNAITGYASGASNRGSRPGGRGRVTIRATSGLFSFASTHAQRQTWTNKQSPLLEWRKKRLERKLDPFHLLFSAISM